MIPKPNQVGKERPLGIPVQIDRAMQNLILLTLDPIIEETSDLYSFGFRKFRSPGLAMARIRFILDKRTAPQYI
jgi:retron-type reverse transcriptase